MIKVVLWQKNTNHIFMIEDLVMYKMSEILMMPVASKSNIHGYIHGICSGTICNTGGVEESYVNVNHLRG